MLNTFKIDTLNPPYCILLSGFLWWFFLSIFIGVAIHHCLHLTLKQVWWGVGGGAFLEADVHVPNFHPTTNAQVTNVLALPATGCNEERMGCIALQSNGQLRKFEVVVMFI